MSLLPPSLCPNLQAGNYEVTSPFDPLYNCIGWTVGTKLHYIWPDQYEQYAWPPNIPRQETLEAFVSFYGLLGYKRCRDVSLQSGIEKVAIFGQNDNVPTHAALQLPTGCWTSKMGDGVDISHELDAVGGGEYGRVITALARSRSNTPPPLPSLHPPPGLVTRTGVTMRRTEKV